MCVYIYYIYIVFQIILREINICNEINWELSTPVYSWSELREL